MSVVHKGWYTSLKAIALTEIIEKGWYTSLKDIALTEIIEMIMNRNLCTKMNLVLNEKN